MVLTDVIRGGQLAVQGFAFLAQHRVLWTWAVLPLGVNILVCTGTFVLFLTFYGTFYGLATGFIPTASPEHWYAWLWAAPVAVLAWGVGLLLFLAGLAFVYLIFLVLGTAIASPFLDVLAQRVETLIAGRAPGASTSDTSTWVTVGTSILDGLRKLGFFLGIQALCFLLGLIPLLAPCMVFVGFLITLLFLPLEYASFALDHRQLRFAQQRQLLWRHWQLMLGFGAVAFLTLLVPLLNFLCLPALVTGGTLLVLHIETSLRRPLGNASLPPPAPGER